MTWWKKWNHRSHGISFGLASRWWLPSVSCRMVFLLISSFTLMSSFLPYILLLFIHLPLQGIIILKAHRKLLFCFLLGVTSPLIFCGIPSSRFVFLSCLSWCFERKKKWMEVYNFGNNFDEYFRMLMQRNSQFIFIPHLVLSSMKQQQGLHFFMVSN